jgi:hypothetical protein
MALLLLGMGVIASKLLYLTTHSLLSGLSKAIKALATRTLSPNLFRSVLLHLVDGFVSLCQAVFDTYSVKGFQNSFGKCHTDVTTASFFVAHFGFLLWGVEG